MIQVTNKTIDDVMPRYFIPDGLDEDETQFIKDGYYVVRYFNKICFQNRRLKSNLGITYKSILKKLNTDNKNKILDQVRSFLSSIEYVNCEELNQYIID